MSLALELRGGGHATIVETDGSRVSLASTKPAPPGSTLLGTLEGQTLQVKVRGCQQEGSEYRIVGRFVNLSRQQRALLLG